MPFFHESPLSRGISLVSSGLLPSSITRAPFDMGREWGIIQSETSLFYTSVDTYAFF